MMGSESMDPYKTRNQKEAYKMTEMEFGERLRKYRRMNNMTQQELAERLGVSDKSVSRWENGSYPDVPLLGKLAKELGVTVDDLLGETPPVRNLERTDWQNLMSYAFAIGGGVLFYLLNLFLPSLLCYGAYLGMMAYGVYLQKNYTFHSKWFHIGNLVMNFFVNMQFLTGFLQALTMLYTVNGSLNFLNILLNESTTNYAHLISPTAYGIIFGLRPVMALMMTALIGWCVRQWWVGETLLSGLSFSPKNFTVTKVLPCIFPLLMAGYWWLFSGESVILPIWFYQHQGIVFTVLWAVMAVLTILLLILSHHPWTLLPAGLMLVGSLSFPLLCTSLRCIGLGTGNLYENTGSLNPKAYVPFLEPADERLPIFVILFVAVYLLCCCITFRGKKQPYEGK